MKHFLKKLAAGAAALALFGATFVSCGGGDDDDDGFKSQSVTISVEELGTSAESATSSDDTVATAAVSEGALTITSKKAGETTVLAKATGFTDAVISVKVNAAGAIEKTVTKFVAKNSDSEDPENPDNSEEEPATQKTVSSIAIDTENTKTEYVVGAELSVSLTVTYSDGTSGTVTTGYTSTYDKTQAGAQTVTITYAGQTTQLEVTVKDVKVTKVEKNADSAAISVEWGKDLDLTGLKLDVTFDDGTSATETSGFTVTGYDKTDTTKVGGQTITVSYGTKADTDGASNSIELAITITNPVKSIAAALASGVTFTEGDTVAKDKLVVELVKANGDKEATDAYDFAPTAALTTSDTKITVTPTGDYATLEAKEVEITVAEKTWAHTYEISLIPGGWSNIPSGKSNKNDSNEDICLNVSSIENDNGYFEKGVTLLPGARAIYRTDKSAICLDKSSTAQGTTSGMLLGAQIAGKFKIAVKYVETGTTTVSGNKVERSWRKVNLYRLDSTAVSDLAAALATDVSTIAASDTVSASQAADEKTISLVYDGESAYSLVGLTLTNDGSQTADATGVAGYIEAITLYTDTEIADDTYPATALTVYQKDGTTEIADNGALEISKADSGYTLIAVAAPAWTTDDIAWSVATANSPITVTDGKITFADTSITTNTVADITVKAGNVTKTVKLTVTAEISNAQKVAKTKEEVQAVVDAFKWKATDTYLNELKAAISSATKTYSDVTVADATQSGANISITISKDSTTDTVTATYPTQDIVDAALAFIKAADDDGNKKVAWDTTKSATDNKSAIEAAISGLTLTPYQVTTAVANDDTSVTVTVTSNLVNTVTASTVYKAVSVYTLTVDSATSISETDNTVVSDESDTYKFSVVGGTTSTAKYDSSKDKLPIISFSGAMKVQNNAVTNGISFTTTGEGTVTLRYFGGSTKSRIPHLWGTDGKDVDAAGTECTEANVSKTSTFKFTKAGTYFVGCTGNGYNVISVEVSF